MKLYLKHANKDVKNLCKKMAKKNCKVESWLELSNTTI